MHKKILTSQCTRDWKTSCNCYRCSSFQFHTCSCAAHSPSYALHRSYHRHSPLGHGKHTCNRRGPAATSESMQHAQPGCTLQQPDACAAAAFDALDAAGAAVPADTDAAVAAAGWRGCCAGLRGASCPPLPPPIWQRLPVLLCRALGRAGAPRVDADGCPSLPAPKAGPGEAGPAPPQIELRHPVPRRRARPWLPPPLLSRLCWSRPARALPFARQCDACHSRAGPPWSPQGTSGLWDRACMVCPVQSKFQWNFTICHGGFVAVSSHSACQAEAWS